MCCDSLVTRLYVCMSFQLAPIIWIPPKNFKPKKNGKKKVTKIVLTAEWILIFSYYRNPNGFTVDSHLQCAQCNANVHVGTGGYRNLELHINSKACKDRQKTEAQTEKKSKSLLSFFGPRKPTKQNVPRVATPPLVHAEPIQQINTAGQTLLPPSPQKIQDEHDATLLQTDKDTYLFDKSKGCPHAIGILQKLQEKMDLIPKETAPAGPEHPLAVFSDGDR